MCARMNVSAIMLEQTLLYVNAGSFTIIYSSQYRSVGKCQVIVQHSKNKGNFTQTSKKQGVEIQIEGLSMGFKITRRYIGNASKS